MITRGLRIKTFHGLMEYRINAGSRTTAHGSCKTALEVAGKMSSGAVTALFAGTIRTTGLPQQQNARSLDRYLVGPGHRITYNYWNSRRESLLEVAIVIDRLDRGEDIYIFLDRMYQHLTANFVLFRSTQHHSTRLHGTGGWQKRGMLLNSFLQDHLCSSTTRREARWANHVVNGYSTSE